MGKGQDIADDRITGFDSACSRTDQCDISQEVSAVSNSIGGSTNTVQRVSDIQFDRFDGTLNLTIYVL